MPISKEVRDSVVQAMIDLNKSYDSLVGSTLYLEGFKPELCDNKDYMDAMESLRLAKRRITVAMSLLAGVD